MVWFVRRRWMGLAVRRKPRETTRGFQNRRIIAVDLLEVDAATLHGCEPRFADKALRFRRDTMNAAVLRSSLLAQAQVNARLNQTGEQAASLDLHHAGRDGFDVARNEVVRIAEIRDRDRA